MQVTVENVRSCINEVFCIILGYYRGQFPSDKENVWNFDSVLKQA